jgi:hypothetical protein
MRFILSLAVGTLALATAADAAMTGIYRTSSPSGSASSLTLYSSLSTLAGNSGGASGGSISPSIANAKYVSVFGDFTQSQTTQGFIYKSVYNAQGRISQIVRYEALATDPLGNFRTDTGGVTFNLSGFGSSAGWDREDDMFADGLGNFYRNGTSSTGNNGVTKYTSFQDFVSNTNGTYFAYGTTYGWNDRFFAFEGKFYRTNTGGPNGSVSSFAVYNSFSDLVNRNVAQTINSTNWDRADLFIPVPAPGALALLGVAGVVGSRRARR